MYAFPYCCTAVDRGFQPLFLNSYPPIFFQALGLMKTNIVKLDFILKYIILEQICINFKTKIIKYNIVSHIFMGNLSLNFKHRFYT